jgi:hypothetical protein
MVNDNIFRFQVHRIAKNPLRNWLQTHRNTFRMTRDTYVEIPYWFLDLNDEIEEVIAPPQNNLTFDDVPRAFHNWMSQLALIIKNGGGILVNKSERAGHCLAPVYRINSWVEVRACQRNVAFSDVLVNEDIRVFVHPFEHDPFQSRQCTLLPTERRHRPRYVWPRGRFSPMRSRPNWLS